MIVLAVWKHRKSCSTRVVLRCVFFMGEDCFDLIVWDHIEESHGGSEC